MRFVKRQYSGSGLHVLAIKTAHAVRFKKADILALNEAHVCVSSIKYAQWSAPRKDTVVKGLLKIYQRRHNQEEPSIAKIERKPCMHYAVHTQVACFHTCLQAHLLNTALSLCFCRLYFYVGSVHREAKARKIRGLARIHHHQVSTRGLNR